MQNPSQLVYSFPAPGYQPGVHVPGGKLALVKGLFVSLKQWFLRSAMNPMEHPVKNLVKKKKS